MQFTFITLAALLSASGAMAANCWVGDLGPEDQTQVDMGAAGAIADQFCGGLPGTNWGSYDYHGKRVEISFTLNGGNNFGRCKEAILNIFSQCGVVGGNWEFEGQYYRTDLK